MDGRARRAPGTRSALGISSSAPARRLTLDVPPALTDPAAAARARRSRSRSRAVGARRRRGDAAGRRAGPRGRPAGADGDPDAAHRRSARAMPGRSPFRAARSIRTMPRRPRPRCARPTEEIGLDRGLVEPIGYLDLYLTFSGFRILPTVARVVPAMAHAQPLRGRGCLRGAARLPDGRAEPSALHSRDWNGITRHYYAMPYQERYIWGVTAGILRNLYERHLICG